MTFLALCFAAWGAINALGNVYEFGIAVMKNFGKQFIGYFGNALVKEANVLAHWSGAKRRTNKAVSRANDTPVGYTRWTAPTITPKKEEEKH